MFRSQYFQIKLTFKMSSSNSESDTSVTSGTRLAPFGPAWPCLAPLGPAWPCMATLQFKFQGTLRYQFAKVNNPPAIAVIILINCFIFILKVVTIIHINRFLFNIPKLID